MDGFIATRDGSGVYVLHISHASDLDRVCLFLRTVHISVEVNEDGTIAATAPGARTPLHERREIAGYVTTWNALNPSSPVTIAEVPQ
jgi:hypothetical protein